MRFLNSILLLSLFGIVLGSCGTKTPPRDHIPAIKANLMKLQEAVKNQDRAVIDSVLSPTILEKGQSSDSLLNYVYNKDGFGFEQFGQASITYTFDKGRIDCYIMDSTHTKDRPLTFFIVLEHEMWLFSGFQLGTNYEDSVLADTL